MGNCCCIVRQIDYKSDGTKFYEFPYLVGKDYDYVFNIISKRYNNYKIISVKENNFAKDYTERKTVYIFFTGNDKKVTSVEVFP